MKCLQPMPKRPVGADHVQRIYLDAGHGHTVPADYRDVRLVADMRGPVFAALARVIWCTPLALIARNLHRLRWRGEGWICDKPLRDPVRTWVVTRFDPLPAVD